MLFPSKKAVGFFAGVLWFLSTTAATAHHAFSSEFDAQKPFELKHVTTKKKWIDTHGLGYVDVRVSKISGY